MQIKTVLLLLAISITLFTGCLDQAAADLTVDELYGKASIAMSESNSTLYEANVMWDDGQFLIEKEVKGTATLTPAAYQKELKTQVDSVTDGLSVMSVEGGKYLVDGIVYSELAETTWLKAEENEHRNYLLPDEDPFGHILFLEGSSLEGAVSSKIGESFVLTFEEDSSELKEMLEKKLDEWIHAIYFEFIFDYGDELRNLVVTEADYEMVVDSDTYLPQSVSLSFKADFQLGNSQEELEHTASFIFLEYGNIENISVPGGITELAFPSSAVGWTDPNQPLKVFEERGFNFTIEYPLHWRYEIYDDFPGMVVLRGPEATIDYHTYLSLISLESVRIGGYYTDQDDVFDMVQGHYASIDGELLGYEKSLPFYVDETAHNMLFAAYACVYEDADGFSPFDEYVDYLEYVMIVDGADDFYYLITFSSPAARSDYYIELVDAMLDTLSWSSR